MISVQQAVKRARNLGYECQSIGMSKEKAEDLRQFLLDMKDTYLRMEDGRDRLELKEAIGQCEFWIGYLSRVYGYVG